MAITTPTTTRAPYQSVNEKSIWALHPRKYNNILLNVCAFILVMELAERLSYYGINQGLKNFMKAKLGWSSVGANALKSTWTSLCYLSPLVGAWIADEKWGRFKTILIFGVWYLIGDFMVAIAAEPSIAANKSTSNAIFMIGLFLGIGVGTGAIKSNVVTFGADQFDPNDPHQVTQRAQFFSWFYWCINIGATVSYGYLSILCVKGSGIIPKEEGYFATYLICALVMTLAIIILYLGKSRYVMVPPSESALSKLCSVIWANFSLSSGAKAIVYGFLVFLLSFVVNVIAAFILDSNETLGQVLTYIAGSLGLIGIMSWIIYGMNPAYMDSSKRSMGGHLDDKVVEEIKLVIRVLPFASFMVMWHCVYDQIDANFQSVTQQCDLRLAQGEDATQIPGATLGVFGTISIIVIIPILEMAIYPLYRKITKRDPSPFGKVFAGLTVATITMFWTGGFETMRRQSGPLIRSNCTSIDIPQEMYQEEYCFILDNGGFEPMNDISWTWAIPMYLMVGAAECLINVTAFDVFYSNVPEYLKSTCQAINLFMIAMGANVTSIFTLLFTEYTPNNLNNGNLEYMYYAVGVASIVNLLMYTYVMHSMQFGMTSSPKIRLSRV